MQHFAAARQFSLAQLRKWPQAGLRLSALDRRCRSRDRWDNDMRITEFLRIAAEAEILRLRHMLARQGRRAAFGAVGAFFGLSVVVLADVIGWQLLRLYVTPIYATLILLGVNLILTAIFAALASWSSPGRAEEAALRVRRDALQGARSSLVLTSVLPVAGTAIRLWRGKSPRRRSLLALFRR